MQQEKHFPAHGCKMAVYCVYLEIASAHWRATLRCWISGSDNCWKSGSLQVYYTGSISKSRGLQREWVVTSFFNMFTGENQMESCGVWVVLFVCSIGNQRTQPWTLSLQLFGPKLHYMQSVGSDDRQRSTGAFMCWRSAVSSLVHFTHRRIRQEKEKGLLEMSLSVLFDLMNSEVFVKVRESSKDTDLFWGLGLRTLPKNLHRRQECSCVVLWKHAWGENWLAFASLKSGSRLANLVSNLRTMGHLLGKLWSRIHVCIPSLRGNADQVLSQSFVYMTFVSVNFQTRFD